MARSAKEGEELYPEGAAGPSSRVWAVVPLMCSRARGLQPLFGPTETHRLEL